MGTSQIYIGLMSGTSTDGVDGVLADLGEAGQIRILASASVPFPPALRDELLSLNSPGYDELERAARAAHTLSACYVKAVKALLDQSGLPASQVRAIGAHGQTVRHAPHAGFSIQLNAPALLAEHSGIAVVADFRSRDIAAGGQGAPLVPAFHAAWFGDDCTRVILNLGGIANITILGPELRGFDTGPANMLMDTWARTHLGRDYDEGGRWAASGHCHEGLLQQMLAEPWLALPPPKSTGRDLFSADWLRNRLEAIAQNAALAPADVQATLLQFSVRTIVMAIRTQAPDASEVLACGGGALNGTLMTALGQALACPLTTTAAYGVPVQSVEALAFAWLAQAYIQGRAACLPTVTGARHATIAGCLYPA